MKNLLIILSIFLFSCTKTVEQQPESKLIFDNYLPSMEVMLAEKAESLRKPRPPKPPPPPPATIGSALVMIDTDGHVSTGTPWADYYGVNGVLISQASNVTADQVNEIIAECYIAFYQLNISFTSDEYTYQNYIGYKTRAVLTTTDDWYNGGTGVSFVGSMRGANSEVYVFPENMLNITSYIHKVVVHEIGHSLGLYHQSLYGPDCTLLEKYREGWKMGVHWSTVGIFGYGTTYAWNIYQDDVPVMASVVGYKVK